jgi:hypothetical protein
VKYARTVVGYHGCDTGVAEKIWKGEKFRLSRSDHDWLGRGVYFWEYGEDRAMKWAKDAGNSQPAAVGALIQLGRCFDLMDTRYTSDLRKGYEAFARTMAEAQKALPRNEGETPEEKRRKLDCAVINFYLDYLEGQGQAFDTVRCGFTEGGAAFPGSMIKELSHIQLAVRNLDCVLGVFRPILEPR